MQNGVGYIYIYIYIVAFFSLLRKEKFNEKAPKWIIQRNLVADLNFKGNLFFQP